MKLKIVDCSCTKCSKMCHAPCCGTPEDMNKIIDAGYADRLMFDDLPGGEDMIKPALKGYEGEKAPWKVCSVDGCTFWKDGKCELHSLGLKPTQGKLVIHDMSYEDLDKIGDYINKTWENNKGFKTIENWKKINNYIEC